MLWGDSQLFRQTKASSNAPSLLTGCSVAAATAVKFMLNLASPKQFLLLTAIHLFNFRDLWKYFFFLWYPDGTRFLQQCCPAAPLPPSFWTYQERNGIFKGSCISIHFIKIGIWLRERKWNYPSFSEESFWEKLGHIKYKIIHNWQSHRRDPKNILLLTELWDLGVITFRVSLFITEPSRWWPAPTTKHWRWNCCCKAMCESCDDAQDTCLCLPTLSQTPCNISSRCFSPCLCHLSIWD